MRSIFAIVVAICTCLFSFGLGIDALGKCLNFDRSDANYESAVLGYIIRFIMAMVMVALSLLMIHGVKKNRHTLITPWLILEVIGLSCGLLNLCISGGEQSGGAIFWHIFFIIIGFIIWYPVYTLWRDMRQSEAFYNRQSPPYEVTVNYKGEAVEGANMPMPEVV